MGICSSKKQQMNFWKEYKVLGFGVSGSLNLIIVLSFINLTFIQYRSFKVAG